MFPCQACKAKDDEIKHLRSIVDSMLISKGLTPVAAEKAAPALDHIEVNEKANDENIQTFGGD